MKSDVGEAPNQSIPDSSVSPKVEQLISDISWDGELNWENHKRTPFPHQDIGVRWILGVEQKSLSDS
ncbi:hypothetical protein B2J67_09215, partial [Vibrio cholerae]